MGKTSLTKRLDETMRKYGDRRQDGRVASPRTQEMRRQVLTTVFNVLHDKGFRLSEPANLGDRHLRAVVRTWFEAGLAPVTMKNYLSCVDAVYSRMGKAGLVRGLEYYLPEVDPALLDVKTTARKSKSWAEAGIDVLAKIAEADALDERFGLMLRAMLAFGLRRKEVLKCKPWKAAEDDNRLWRIYPNEAKNGRPRIIVIETDAQVQILNYLRSKIKNKGDYLSWPKTVRGKDRSDNWAINRYNDLMKKIGITLDKSGATGHGLRAQYAENAALIAGFVPPTLSGDGTELKKEDLDRKRAIISENLGHSRIVVTGAYYGSFSKLEKVDKAKLKKAIEECISKMQQSGKQETVSKELTEDCKVIMGVLSEYDVPVSLSQVQTLWRRYSQRHGVEWVKPKDDGEIGRGLYVVATMHWRNGDNEGEEVPA